MADNLGMGDDNEVGFRVGIELGNIQGSIEQAGTLASQIKQWREDNEAFVKSLTTTQESLTLLTQEYSTQKQLREETIGAETQLRDLSAQIRDNARSTAQSYQEINSTMSTLSSNLGVTSIPGVGAIGGGMGEAGGAGYGPSDQPRFGGMGGDGTTQAAGAVARIYSETGAAGSTLGRAWRHASEAILSGDALGSDIAAHGGRLSATDMDNISESVAGASGIPDAFGDMEPDDGSGGGGRGARSTDKSGRPRSFSNNAPAMTMQERAVQRMLSIPGWNFGGRTAASVRWLNRLSNGKLSKSLASKSWLVGHEVSNFDEHVAATNLANRQITAMEANGLKVSGTAAEGIYNTFRGYGAAGLEAEAARVGVASGTAALEGGLLGGAARALPVAGAVLAAGQMAYQGYGMYQQAGQQYASATGDYNSAAGLGLDIRARWASFLDPNIGLQQAREIRTQGLARGYRGQTNQNFEEFATYAAHQYGMSTDQSMAMFHDATIKAGIGLQDLKDNLDTLARTAQSTSTSFTSLQQRQIDYSSVLTGIGGKGDSAGAMATAAANAMGGNLILENKPGTANLAATIGGQAMMASSAGVPLSSVYGIMAHGTAAQKLKLQAGADSRVRGILQGIVGVPSTSPGFQAAVESKAIQLMMVLNQFVPPIGNQTAWDEPTAVEYTTQLLSGHGGWAQSSIGDSARNIENLAGGVDPSSSAGLSNIFNGLATKGLEMTNPGLGAGHTGTDVYVRYTDPKTGQTLTKNAKDIANITDQQTKLDIYKNIASGGQHIAEGYTDDKGKIHYGTFKTMGGAIGDTLLNSIENSPGGAQQLIDIAPAAKWLVTLVKDPTALTKQQRNYIAGLGTGQGSGNWDPSSTTGGGSGAGWMGALQHRGG